MRVSIRHTSLRRGFARTVSGIRQRSPAALTAFGETIENGAIRSTPTPSTYTSFFTGKPEVAGLGHTFLFRNYRASLAYPDGWNQLAYCGNGVIYNVDLMGCAYDSAGLTQKELEELYVEMKVVFQYWTHIEWTFNVMKE